MINLSWLENIEAVPVEEKVKVIVSRKKEFNPTGLQVRVFKDGRVFPSIELVEAFNLEYGVEDSNGFDIIDSREWGQVPKVDNEGNSVSAVLLFAVVNKELPKVDLFGYAKLETTSVLTQGSKKPELIDKLKSIYNLDTDTLFENNDYVDLQINTNIVVFPGLINYFLPKKIVKGAKAGTLSYETRYNVIVHPVTINRG